MSKVRFLVVTTSRADYGILYPLLKAMEQDESFELLIAVTGSHLSKEYGYTLDEIICDGFKADVLVDMNPKDDSSLEISNSISKGILGFAESYKRLSPDGVIVLGDRYELYAACIPALIARIPIVHIHGGEVTKGAMDDAIRH
ncbi:MAG TPA: UDP-N-acetylglucosamine 2-epimerase, partial [Clostridia bacterium]